MMVVRSTTFALALVSASSFEIVSQTFKGHLKMNSSNAAVPSPTMATVELGLDMESVKMFQNEHIVIEVPAAHMTSITKSSMIFDAEAKRATMYTSTEIKSAAPIPSPPATCKYFEFPSLPAPAAVAKCLQGLAALAKPVSSDDGLLKFHMNMPVSTASATAEEVVYTDTSFIMKKLVADITMTGAHAMTIHEEMVDMDSKAGAPVSSVFVVPTEWGTCTKEATPSIPAVVINNPVMKSFWHCMGMGSSEALLMV